ncbi:MAG: aminotransferase class V-fold PLP-dependent enzyme [bacterium]
MLADVKDEVKIARLRKEFPILSRQVNGKPLVYFDNAATAQRPQCVIDAVSKFYQNHNANVHRGVHSLSQEATDLFEEARNKVKGLLNAASLKEIIWTRGVTEGINLVASSFVRPRLSKGDQILITYMEHHSNIVPWQLLCDQTGAELIVVPVNQRGELDLQAMQELMTERVKFMGIVHISNSLGTINPVKEVVQRAHQHNIPVLIDGAQATPHLTIDVQDLDCDFYCVSAHKMYGPTGIGALYGKQEHLENMPPYHGGGEMIAQVSFEKTTFAELPSKFEAGTPNIAGAIGFGAAIDFVARLDVEWIAKREQYLLAVLMDAIKNIAGLRVIGTAENKSSVLSFVLDGIHPHDVGTILDYEGIAIRTGHHCTMPLLKYFGVPGTARASLAFYNTEDEIRHFVKAIERTQEMFL